MDLSMNELLLKRLKCLEFQGNFTPTMGMISKSNLNPQFFKIRKVFSKKSQLSLEPRNPKLKIDDILRRRLRKTSKWQSLLPTKSKKNNISINSLTSKLPKLSKIPEIPHISYQSPTYSIANVVKPKKLRKGLNREANLRYGEYQKRATENELKQTAIEGSRVALNTKTNIQQLLVENGCEENISSQSLDLTSSRRHIIFSKTRNHKSKDFASFYNGTDAEITHY